MKKSFMFIGCALAALVFAGCSSSYSVKPYYTADNKIDVPTQMIGEWRAESQKGISNPVQVIIDKSGKATVRETKKVDGRDVMKTTELKLQFFKIDANTYVDAVLMNHDDKECLAAMMVVPVHVIGKVEYSADSFRIFRPSDDLVKMNKENKLPVVLESTSFEETPGSTASNMVIFTAEGSAWNNILKKNAETVFPVDGASVLFKKVLVK